MTQTKFTYKTYKGSDMCEPLANTTGFWDPGYLYDVLLTDLEPNTRYFYSCGSEEVRDNSISINYSCLHDILSILLKTISH